MKVGQRIYVEFEGDLVLDETLDRGYIHVQDEHGNVHEIHGDHKVWAEDMPPNWPPESGDLWGHLNDRFSVEYTNGVKYFSSGGESTPVNVLVRERPGIRLIQRNVTEDL